MHHSPGRTTLGVSPRTSTRGRSAAGAAALAALAALVVSCGGSDPSKPIQSLQSAAETARLTLHERLDGAVPERYADDVLASIASTIPELRSGIGSAKLPIRLRLAGLIGAGMLAQTIDDARKPGESRVGDAARLDTLAGSLGKLARAAGAKED